MTGGETIDIRAAHRFDEAALTRWLSAHLDGFSGPAEIKQFAGGQSNPTYLIETPARAYVLRRKPPGVTLASAHAVDREFRVMSALGKAGFPVPKVFVFCADTDVIGTAFYVMEHVSGRVFWDPALPEINNQHRRGYHETMIGALAKLHSLDVTTIGLGDFGKAGNYFGRQIARWSRQYQADAQAGRVDDMDALASWLPSNIPPDEETAVVHGDYRMDNLIFAPSEPKAAAVIDWELSTLGHPLADFTNLLLIHHYPQTLMKSLVGLDLPALGVPTEAEATAYYCHLADRPAPDNLHVYHAYNLFRFAAICHGIRGRMLRGNAVSAVAERYARHVEPLAALAVNHAREAGMR